MTGKVLFLSAANPMGIGGGCFASHAYLRALSDIFDGNVDVVMADVWKENWDEKIIIQKRYDAKPLTSIQYVLSLFTGEIQRFSGEADSILKEHPEDYAFVVCNGSSISGKLWKLTQRIGVKLITIHHNYEPEYFADNSKGLHRMLYLPVVKRMERAAYKHSDYNLFLTNQDKKRFEEVYGRNRGKNEIIGVFEFNDFKDLQLQSAFGAPLTYIITGTLCTMQGVDGIKYFFKELYKYIPEDSSVIISGRNPSEEIRKLCNSHKNVKLIANPVNMSEVISSGDVYVCPTRVGGGIKLRVMDGLKLGLPVITHACSARGYDAMFDSAYFKSFESPDEFGKAVKEMESNLTKIRKQDVLDKYKEAFSYESGLSRFKSLFKV